MSRKIYQIAGDIVEDWETLGKGVHFAARPYLGAMLRLESINDSYDADSAQSIVRYFLSNASSYRGARAKALKAELKAML
jgi:hypothetical protein